MACATAWMSALLARMAERPGRERLINVADESWKIVQHTGLGEWFQSNFKLARQFGVMNLVVLHKLADLRAAGDAGSRAARIAEGLDRRRVDPDRLPPGREPGPAHALAARPVRDRVAADLDAVGGAGAVAGRQPLVRRPALPLAARGEAHEHRHRHAGERREGRSRMNSRRGDLVSDGVLLGAIGGVLAVAGDVVAVGRPRRRPVRLGLAPRRRRTAARRSDAAARRGCRTRPARGRPPSASGLPGAPGFYAALAMLAGAGGAVAPARWAIRRTASPRRGWRAVGEIAASCAPCAAPGARVALDGSCSGAGAAGCSTPSSGTRWSRSGRRSRASPPASRSPRCSTGRAPRSPVRSRPICVSCHDRASARARRGVRVRPVRALGAAGAHVVAARTPPTPGTARSRSPGGSPRPVSSTAAASRAATSGRSPPSSGSRRCCTPRP